MADEIFSRYEIKSSQTDSELIPMKITLPVEAVTDNLDYLAIYMREKQAFHVPEKLPQNLDWISFIDEVLLSHAEPEIFGLYVDEIKEIGIKDNKIYIDCLLHDPDWNSF